MAALGGIALLATVVAVRLRPQRAEVVIEDEHEALAPDHPHLADAVAAGNGWRHSHQLVAEPPHARL